MNNMLVKRSSFRNMLIAIPLFILSPLISFPLILWGIYRREKWAILLFSLFIGLLSYLTIPFADLYRHRLIYDIMEDTSVREYFGDLNGFFNWMMPFLYIEMNRFDIPFDFLRLFELSTGILMLFAIFEYKMNHSSIKYTNKEYFCRFLILYLFFDFIFTTSGVIYGYALCIYIFSLFLIFEKNNRVLAFLFAYISCCIHSSFLFFIVLTIVLYMLKLNRKGIVIMCVIIPIITSFIFPYVSFLIENQAEWYFSNSKEFGNTFSNLTTIGKTAFVLLKIVLFPFIVLMFKCYSRQNNWCLIFASWFVMAISFLNNLIVFQRLVWGIMSLGIFLLLSIEDLEKVKRKCTIFIVAGLMFTVLNTLDKHKMILNSNYYRIIYPIPTILSHQYERKWLDEHVDGNDILQENNH